MHILAAYLWTYEHRPRSESTALSRLNARCLEAYRACGRVPFGAAPIFLRAIPFRVHRAGAGGEAGSGNGRCDPRAPLGGPPFFSRATTFAGGVRSRA